MFENRVLEPGQLLRLLETAVRQAKEAVLITSAMLDPPGPQILFVNPAFSEMTGYSQEEVLDKTPRILQGPKSDRVMLQRLREALVVENRFPARRSITARTAASIMSNGT